MEEWIDFIERLHEEGQISSATRQLVENGVIEVCPICLALNAFSQRHANDLEGIVVGSHQQGGWTCGQCGTQLPERTSPLSN
ncbi:hypothetical protein Pan216_04830 [Planctomycetes bacterium Pan216]|uniref:Uncharacterized protein n=1 Tax=Kolteria novifilia TaxID=2527975 RepID=A0A518AY50_9BACT|nr:hypothetical protein Pan216_04830 [Planctomycetes bacterium Pan216]